MKDQHCFSERFPADAGAASSNFTFYRLPAAYLLTFIAWVASLSFFMLLYSGFGIQANRSQEIFVLSQTVIICKFLTWMKLWCGPGDNPSKKNDYLLKIR
ncbi:MAG: hypothetical protein AAFO69_00055 [Bacteroidota bacterium]